jgi:hypothetical protein
VADRERLRNLRLPLAVAAIGLVVALANSAHAIFWNNDPEHGVVSTTGLTDRVDWFQNVHVINNLSNDRFGTTTLLNSEWAITVRHVVQNGLNYGQITAPENIYVNVLATRYYADQIFTPDGGSEIALVHLRGGVNGALDAADTINTGFDDAGRLVHIGGYGARGYFDGGPSVGSGSFRRAFNIPYVASNGQLRIIADGEQQLESAGLLEGTVGGGDSGGPMWGYYGRGFAIDGAPLNDWRLVGLTATGSGGSGGEAWGGSSNYTRVANYANWINNTLNSLPAPGPTTTGPWSQHNGTGLYDTGGDKLSVTGSNAASAVHANFGLGGNGFTLDSVGDTLAMSAIVDTTLPLAALQLRYGMFDDEAGTIAGNTPAGTAWNGYIVGNATEDGARGVYEKGANGGFTGQWWQIAGRTGGNPIASLTAATGTFDDATGTQSTPAGRYTVSLEYTRVDSGLQIEWSTVEVDAAGLPTGVYSHMGSVLDPTAASSDWTFNKLGFLLYDAAFTGTMIVDDVQVAFTNAALIAGDYDGNGTVDAADYTVWRDSFGQSGDDLAADGDASGWIDAADYEVWKQAYAGQGSGSAENSLAVPEPSGVALIFVALAFVSRLRTRSLFV